MQEPSRAHEQRWPECSAVFRVGSMLLADIAAAATTPTQTVFLSSKQQVHMVMGDPPCISRGC